MSTGQSERTTELGIDPTVATSALDRRAGLEAAYDAHSGAVYGLAVRLCGPARAADVTCEVYLELWRMPDAFDRPSASLRADLLTIAHRRSAALAPSVRPAQVKDHINAPETTNGSVRAPLAEAQAASQPDALEDLPFAERRAIEIALYGECSYQEASSVLGVSAGAVKSRIRQGLRKLRTLTIVDAVGD